jgi:hypothetical protein
MKAGGGEDKSEGEWEESGLNGFEWLLKSTKWRSAEGWGGGGGTCAATCSHLQLNRRNTCYTCNTCSTCCTCINTTNRANMHSPSV